LLKNPFAPIGETVTSSGWHLLASAGLLAAAAISLCTGVTGVAYVQIAVTDLYLLLMLWSVAQLAAHRDAQGKADKTAETWPGTPRRDGALLVLGMLLSAVVTGFASLYTQQGWLAAEATSARVDALYFSVVTMATVGFGDLHPLTGDAKVAVMAQIGSGLLFLAAAIPVLASRLAELD